jgi:hypothetical protein
VGGEGDTRRLRRRNYKGRSSLQEEDEEEILIQIAEIKNEVSLRGMCDHQTCELIPGNDINWEVSWDGHIRKNPFQMG